MKRRQALILFAAVLFCIMLLPGFSIRAEAAEISGDWEYTLDSGIATITRYNGNATTVTVPQMFGNYLVNAIGARAFENNGTMQKVILHDRIISIGDYAFAGCMGLRSIEIPKAVVYLGWGAFKNCTNVSSITIYAKELQDCGWFHDWAGLQDARRPFYGVGTATNGVTVTFAEGCTRVPVGLFHCDGIAEAKANLKTVKMADSVTYIAGCAFDGCDTIETVQFSDNLTTIGRWAFAGCSNLKTSTLPNSVQTVEYGAFQECISLASVTVRAQTIGDYAYSGCVGLKSITLGQNVSYLGWEVFKNCTNVSSITIYAKELQDCGWLHDWKGLQDARRPFYGVGAATNGVTLTFGEGCTTVPVALLYCYNDPASKANIKYVIMSDSVTKIEDHAFDACDTIETVQISRSIQSIDSYAFSVCTGLKRVNFTGNAPAIDNTAFNGVTTNCYYPVGNGSWTESVRQNYSGKLTWKSYDPTIPEKPYSIVNVVSGVHVYWNSVYGVQKYGLFRSETGKNGTYKWIANPTVPHFTDTKVETGKTYYYKVTMIHPTTGKHSEKSEAIGVTYVGTPDITSRFNKAAGITLGWNKIEGAQGYAIYRKSYSGTDAWVRVATISGNSTFTWQDTSVKNANGTAYKYTVRALAGSDLKTLSGCRNAGRSMVRLTSRVLNSTVKAGATSIKCQWTTSSAVTGYEVRFMVGSTVYKTFTIGNYKTGVKTFTGLKAGQTYKIQVRSYVKIDGMGFYSAWSEAKNVKLP